MFSLFSKQNNLQNPLYWMSYTAVNCFHLYIWWVSSSCTNRSFWPTVSRGWHSIIWSGDDSRRRAKQTDFHRQTSPTFFFRPPDPLIFHYSRRVFLFFGLLAITRSTQYGTIRNIIKVVYHSFAKSLSGWPENKRELPWIAARGTTTKNISTP